MKERTMKDRTTDQTPAKGPDELDARLTQALETMPVVPVSDDFALRVMQRIPARQARARVFVADASRVGRRFCFAALVLLAALMFGMVPLASGHQAITAVEWVLCSEFVGLTLWLSPVSRLFER